MPAREKITFQGHEAELAGLLDRPDGPPRACVLFAHCFTCGKNSLAASRIAGALVQRGFAVLRFDFTGLGQSEGEFANANFSSNVQDLLAAADWLRNNLRAPDVLIGHSLGGTAVLHAAHEVAEARAVVCIAAPSRAVHIEHLISDAIDDIEHSGRARVTLGGRSFTIKQQFLHDLQQHDSAEHIARLDKALLLMHSPLDAVVAIDEAEKIYRRARHPKSFVSLNRADHLLSEREQDAVYAADVIAAWAGQYLDADVQLQSDQTETSPDSGWVHVQEQDHRFLCRVRSDAHQWLADEPRALGGQDRGPDPYEHLLAALGACTVMTLRMYIQRKGWPVDDIAARLSHSRVHPQDCADCDEAGARVDLIRRELRIDGDLDEAQRRRLLEIADKCPVHRTLMNTIQVDTAWQA